MNTTSSTARPTAAKSGGGRGDDAAGFLLACVLPAERAGLAATVQQAGGIPVIDLTAGGDPAAVPSGAWVRVRAPRAVPGDGPVVLAVGAVAHALPNRPTWLELAAPGPVPPGIAGVVLRGQGAGGPCGAAEVMSLLAQMPPGVKVVVDGGLDAAGMAAARRAGAAGAVLSDLLLALPELALPPGLSQRMRAADASSTHVVNGFRIQASPLSPVLRALLGGAPFWELCQGWFASDDPSEVAWPAGQAIAQAPEFARVHGSLGRVIQACRGAIAAAGAVPAPRSFSPSAVQSTIADGEAVAIVGLGCRLPGASSVDDFWKMILEGRHAIGEVPSERWDPDLFWDADRSAPDRTYSKIGGFLGKIEFDSRRFRIPPAVAGQIDPVQQITLAATADALADAGLRPTPRDKQGADFDRGRTAVILGNSMGGELTDDYTVRVRVPAFQAALASVPDFGALPEATQQSILAAFADNVRAGLPPITEDSMPGELANVIAGRVANAFDLTGPNFTTDAACASSMAAVQAAVKGLLDGDFDLAITGGADRSMGVATYTKFCKIGALSPNHSVPFDASANGFVMGEGAGILVLKRLSEARRDGDRIYAVVRGIGGSSDGRGKGITAPNPRGQRLALERAYGAAGIDPATVDLVEAHGTSTVVGDKVEVESLSAVIGPNRRGGRGPIRIGSVKSNIGHLKSAAGAASLIKASLAIHHGVLPPSVGFQTGRPDVPFDVVPLQVQARPEAWPAHGPRRAGVSAFGFGGTNFHVVLEQSPELAASAAAVVPDTPTLPLPAGLWAVSAEDRAGLAAVMDDPNAGYAPDAPVRLVASAATAEERAEQLVRVRRVLQKPRAGAMLRSRGIALEEEAFDNKIAFLFTGQGSQYLGMGLDLAAEYDVVAKTFAEADAVMEGELGRPLTAFIRRDPSLEEAVQFAALQDTAISQPATLTVDVAILRLLAAYGVVPDMVAGHSLGEYAAAVAAGMLSFEDALVAVSARGREMAAVQIDDKGLMAGIATSEQRVAEVLAEIDGYVVAANKNCPTQTVIAGETHAVEAAMEAFKSRGITVYPLPVSHAFHSRIVAPASAPLRQVLERLDLRAPRRPITTNVTSGWYPTGEGARDAVLDILARQVAAPVEWIAQLERMYADGARVFVECGPKRALSGFVATTFKRRPHRALYTNHPKRGGLASFRDALAGMVALGLPVRAEPGEPDIFAESSPRRASSAALAARAARFSAQPVVTEEPTAATSEVAAQVRQLVAHTSGYAAEELSLDDEFEADLGIDTVKQAELVARMRDHFRLEHDPAFRLSDMRSIRDLARYATQRLGASQPRPLPALVPDRALPLPAPRRATPARPTGLGNRGGLGEPAALAALMEGALRAGLDQSDASSVSRAVLPAVQGLVQTLVQAMAAQRPAPAPAPPPAPAPVVMASAPAPSAARVSVVATGAAVGLPGGREVFDPNNIRDILAGQNRISALDVDQQDAFLARNIVRLRKDPKTGQGTFEPVERRDQVIRLAGVKGDFDLDAYGIDPGLRRALDITTELAFAAGIEALRDAGVPLVEERRKTRSGRTVSAGWKLPPSLRDGTGVIFATAFPGYTNLLKHVAQNGDDGEGRFDRRFLFQILSMGHSQFAQLIGARGPNTQVNAACASTTQAVALAEDWLRGGRAERVVILGVDDVTNEQMLSWIGAGFLAAGAATTEDKVENAALPFDERRHGMLLGMGAVGLVVENEAVARRRGMAPIARLLATRLANSAFHGTRLDADHIAAEMDQLVGAAAEHAGVDRSTLARGALFMSHETYTPARGGSAAAEINALRTAFGAAASEVIVTNTKGFTGHPMGAGIEDAIVLKALQMGQVPPIPNLEQPDPDLGALTLSRGGAHDRRFALRLAAGFGSQVALAAWEKVASGEDRVVDAAAHTAWLSTISGFSRPELRVEARTLRLVEAAAVEAPAPASAPAPAPVSAPAPAPAVAAGPALQALRDDVAGGVIAILAEKTGYGPEELDPTYELEADLGIDTVKQAEVLAQIGERYGLPADAPVQLSASATIQDLVDEVVARLAGTGGPAAADPTPAPPPAALPDDRTSAAETASAADTAAAPGSADMDAVRATVLAVLAAKTGYGVEELEDDYELEADLGIDTVKQAEVLAQLGATYGLPADAPVQLGAGATVAGLIHQVGVQVGAGGGAPAAGGAPAPGDAPAAGGDEAAGATAPAVDPAADSRSAAPAPEAAAGGEHSAADAEAVRTLFLDILAEKTGYGVDELEDDYELEADLGVDTVKQAEVLSELRERLALGEAADLSFSTPPTIADLINRLVSLRSAGPEVSDIPEVSENSEKSDVSDGSEMPESAEVPVGDSAAPAPDTPAPAAEDSPVGAAAGGDDDSPLALDARGLPVSFRLRRPAMVARPALHRPRSLAGRVICVLGEGPYAEALRQVASDRGCSIAAEASIVIDAEDSVMESFREARARAVLPPLRWICATRTGSDPSWVDPELGLAAGARAGLAKSLGREWESCGAQVIDVDPMIDDDDAARRLLDELAADDPATEIYLDGENRQILSLALEEFPPQGGVLRDDPVIVVTGGTRGVTSLVARELARRSPCKLVLLARTAPGTEALDEAEAKARIRAQLESEGIRATPARIDAALAPLRKAEEARQTMVDIEAMGRPVRFYPVDMTDEQSVAEVLETITAELGFVDGVIHGAGIEQSRLISDKTDADFVRVFASKARGGWALTRSLPRISWFVSMGSVAGRFGNAGQVDYAAANDAMARVCLSRPRSLHVDWTAWADVGMATRGGMQGLLESRGVELLPAEAGASLLVDMIASGMTGEVVVAGALGGFGTKAPHPLLDTIEYVGDRVIGRTRLSRVAAPWLDDHAIDGLPVLPGVVGLELMAATAALARPGVAYSGARNVRFAAPLKVHGDGEVEVVIEVESDDAGAVHCTLRSERSSRTGRTLRAEHFSATLVLGDPPASEGLPAAFFFSEEPLTSEAIYERFFHGPGFQVLREAGAIAQQGLIADVTVDHSALGGLAGLHTAPLVLEAAFQGAGLHRMAIAGQMALPASIDEVTLLQVPEDGAPLGLMVQRRDGASEVYDVDVDGPAGAVLRLRGFRMIDTGPLDEGDRITPPDGGWPVVVVARAVQRSGPLGQARSILHPVELAEIQSRGLPSRQRDRVAGRVAARRAVGALLGHEDWILRTAPSGAPVVDILAPVAPRVTVTHRDGRAFAAASLRGQIGIDREQPQLRSVAFQRTWLLPEERAWAGADAWRQTAVWCVKEAVLKALGTGMAISPREVCLVGVRGRRVEVRLLGEARARHRALGGGSWCIVLGDGDGDVVAAAALADSSPGSVPAGAQPLFSIRRNSA